MKNIFIIGGVLVLFLAGGVWWSKSLQSNDPNIISTQGVHWHPHLTIYVNGEKQDIPANIGIGLQYAGMPTYDSSMRMTAMHTHEPDGIIHLEFPGRVAEEDIRFGNFFRIWGKSHEEFGSVASVTINDKETDNFLEYPLRDGDVIVMNYE